MFHLHKWRTTDVENITVWEASRPNAKNPIERYSDIHRVCEKCGKAKTVQREGHWRLEEFNK